MATIFLRHPVADYDAWRPLFDADAARRHTAGMTLVGVFRDASDANSVLVVFDTDDVSGFEAMLADEELKAAMEEAGVTGPPEVWIAGQ